MLAQIDHPLVDHWITELRDVETAPPRFRGLVRNLSAALFLEATRDLALAGKRVRTPGPCGSRPQSKQYFFPLQLGCCFFFR